MPTYLVEQSVASVRFRLCFGVSSVTLNNAHVPKTYLQQLRYPVWPGSSRDTRTAPSRFFKLWDILDYNLLCRVSGDVFMLQFACLQRSHVRLLELCLMIHMIRTRGRLTCRLSRCCRVHRRRRSCQRGRRRRSSPTRNGGGSRAPV